MSRSYLLATSLLAFLTACPKPSAPTPQGQAPQAQQPNAPVVAAEAAPVPSGPPRTLPAAAPGTAPIIPVNSIIPGELGPGDVALSDESFGDDYGIMLTQGQPVTVVVRGGPATGGDAGPGATLDVQTVLLLNDQQVAADDDSARQGNALNSRIVYSPPVTGLYVIRVTTSGSGAKPGQYTMQVYPGALLRQL